MRFKFKQLALGLACTCVLAIYGCGGGADTSSSLTLSGVAATGAAINGGAVDVVCASGTGSGTTASDDTGSYTVAVTDGTLPCVAKVTATDGTILHSVAQGTGNSATANITPLTELVVANLAGTDPASYFAAFNSTAAANITTDKVTNAQTAVITLLTDAGVDMNSVGDLLIGSLTPKTASSTGNAYDVALDTLKTQLANSNATLTSLVSSVAASSSVAVAVDAAKTTATDTGPSLPAHLLMKTAATTCSALRSATYRLIRPVETDKISTFTLDASALTLSGSSTESWTAHATENCHFTANSGKTDIFVSQAGVIAMRYTKDGGTTYSMALAFPKQTHTLSELAGNWNLMGMEYVSSNVYTGITASATLDASGAMSNAQWCQDDSAWNVSTNCAAASSTSTYSTNINGYFDVTGAGDTAASGYLFLYAAGNGALMGVQVGSGGGLVLFTKQRANALPTVGTVSSNWSIQLRNSLYARTAGNTSELAISANTQTIVSTDTSAGSFVRNNKSIGSSPSDEHTETFVINSPRAGYKYRDATTVTDVSGTTQTIREVTNLGLRGMGISASLIPYNKRFQISVDQP